MATKDDEYRCGVFDGHVGYKGQKYKVVFTDEDGKEHIFGWQNEKTGGLAKAAALHPGWKQVRVIKVTDTKAGT